MDALAQDGYSTSVALEPEFHVLTRDVDGDFHPTNETRIFTQAGLVLENELIQRIFRKMSGMGISVSQIGNEYGPGQYEMTTRMALHSSQPMTISCSRTRSSSWRRAELSGDLHAKTLRSVV